MELKLVRSIEGKAKRKHVVNLTHTPKDLIQSFYLSARSN